MNPAAPNPAPPPVRRQRISLWIIGACLVLATQSIALDWSAGVVVDRGVLGRSALLALEPWFPWILLAFPLAWIHRRFSLVRGFSWTFGLVHLAMAVVVSVAILEGWDRWSEPLLHGVHEQMAMDYLRPCLEDEDFFLPGELSCPTTEFGVEDLPPFPYSNLLRGVPFEVETVIVGGHVGYAGFYDRLPRFLTYVLTYAGLLAMSQALLVRFEMARAREDAALMRSRVDRMRLDALRARIEPHFLFNALAAVSATVEEDPPTARAMLGDLATLMRESNARDGGLVIPLADELRLTRAYVDLTRRRYGDRLVVDYDVPDEVLAFGLPAWSLQPLVENVVVHGVERSRITVTARVRATVERGRLLVEVSDDAEATEEDGLTPSGTALANLRERLVALHGDDARLHTERGEVRGFVARLDLPARRVEAST